MTTSAPPPGPDLGRERSHKHRLQQQQLQQQGIITQTYEIDRVPVLGLDRAWEMERARGMELLTQSVERQRQRQRHRDGHDHHRGAREGGGGAERGRHRGRGRKKKKDKNREQRASRSESRERLDHFFIDPNLRVSSGSGRSCVGHT